MPPKTIHIRPTPIEGPRARVVPLDNGSILPAEGKLVVETTHVRMLLKHGDVEEFVPPESEEPAGAADAAPEAPPTKSHRRTRGEEQSE